jgi:hypothetical protein
MSDQPFYAPMKSAPDCDCICHKGAVVVHVVPCCNASSPMTDQPFYAPNRKPPPPPPPRKGEPLWIIQKAGRRLACELRDDGAAGVEVQVYRDGELLYGRRWANRALALAEADERKAQYLGEGGVLIA